MFNFESKKEAHFGFLENAAKEKNKRVFLKTVFSLFLFLAVWSSKDFTARASSQWYNKGPIVHACGRYKGRAYTNSIQALKYTLSRSSYKNGITIEIDFGLTSDKQLVCIHDWAFHNRINHIRSKKRMSLKRFKRSHTQSNLTTMTGYQAIKIMARYPQSYLVVDTKEKGVLVYKKLVQICRQTGNRKFLDRIVVQLYNFSDYWKIRKVYPFKHWCFSAYKFGFETPAIISRLVYFSRRYHMDALVLPASALSYRKYDMDLKNYRFDRKSLAAIKYGRVIPVICHTVNSKTIYKQLRRVGVRNVFSDVVNLNQK